MARGLLGRNSNLHIRQRRRDALKEADLVILAGKAHSNFISFRSPCSILILNQTEISPCLGTVCDFRLSYGRVLNRKSKIVAVNRNKSQLWKVMPAALSILTFLTIIPRARMGSESIAHKAEGQMGY